MVVTAVVVPWVRAASTRFTDDLMFLINSANGEAIRLADLSVPSNLAYTQSQFLNGNNLPNYLPHIATGPLPPCGSPLLEAALFRMVSGSIQSMNVDQYIPLHRCLDVTNGYGWGPANAQNQPIVGQICQWQQNEKFQFAPVAGSQDEIYIKPAGQSTATQPYVLAVDLSTPGHFVSLSLADYAYPQKTSIATQHWRLVSVAQYQLQCAVSAGAFFLYSQEAPSTPLTVMATSDLTSSSITNTTGLLAALGSSTLKLGFAPPLPSLSQQLLCQLWLYNATSGPGRIVSARWPDLAIGAPIGHNTYTAQDLTLVSASSNPDTAQVQWSSGTSDLSSALRGQDGGAPLVSSAQYMMSVRVSGASGMRAVADGSSAADPSYGSCLWHAEPFSTASSAQGTNPSHTIPDSSTSSASRAFQPPAPVDPYYCVACDCSDQ